MVITRQAKIIKVAGVVRSTLFFSAALLYFSFLLQKNTRADTG